jgi:hypothetical protein
MKCHEGSLFIRVIESPSATVRALTGAFRHCSFWMSWTSRWGSAPGSADVTITAMTITTQARAVRRVTRVNPAFPPAPAASLRL